MHTRSSFCVSVSCMYPSRRLTLSCRHLPSSWLALSAVVRVRVVFFSRFREDEVRLQLQLQVITQRLDELTRQRRQPASSAATAASHSPCAVGIRPIPSPFAAAFPLRADALPVLSSSNRRCAHTLPASGNGECHPSRATTPHSTAHHRALPHPCEYAPATRRQGPVAAPAGSPSSVAQLLPRSTCEAELQEKVERGCLAAHLPTISPLQYTCLMLDCAHRSAACAAEHEVDVVVWQAPATN